MQRLLLTRCLFVMPVLVLVTTACGLEPASAPKKVTEPFFVDGQDPRPKNKNWVLVENLSDEFEGDTLDSEKWDADPNRKGWGWIGWPPGLFKPENVKIADGKMNVMVMTLSSCMT
ncbi:hypothetical protein SH528x_002089 [Novipirellula sp. SH528]|uniref:hypothetical protein n=1 Tax=Novipirellula sp. SH528 TaxID=3454466 RepID=UPI003FA17061